MKSKKPLEPATPTRPRKAPARDYCAIGGHAPLNTSEERAAGLCAYHIATLSKQ